MFCATLDCGVTRCYIEIGMILEKLDICVAEYCRQKYLQTIQYFKLFNILDKILHFRIYAYKRTIE